MVQLQESSGDAPTAVELFDRYWRIALIGVLVVVLALGPFFSCGVGSKSVGVAGKTLSGGYLEIERMERSGEIEQKRQAIAEAEARAVEEARIQAALEEKAKAEAERARAEAEAKAKAAAERNAQARTSGNGQAVDTQAGVKPGGARVVRGILVVNKKHGLDPNYAPGENPEAKAALNRLIAQMRAEGLPVSDYYSGYRSYSHQKALFDPRAAVEGVVSAERHTARPGFSEHQTGLAFDVLATNGYFVLEGTPQAKWLAERAHEFGFIVRYLKGKEAITGYQYEPWHIRYIGSEATPVWKSGLALEEYLGVEGGDYRR